MTRMELGLIMRIKGHPKPLSRRWKIQLRGTRVSRFALDKASDRIQHTRIQPMVIASILCRKQMIVP
jgi:hypothetical protein